MAEILIKAVDAKMPTIQEWRDWMNTIGIPKAQKYLNENPYSQSQFDICHANLNRMQDYRWAKVMFGRYVEGKVNFTPEEVQELMVTIQDYESNPVSQADFDFAKKLLFDESKTVPSIETRWKYHKNIIEVEALKTDEIKDAELKEKDQRGCYKQGYPVVVMPDNHVWGNCEGLPNFVVIKVPMIPVEKVQKYIEMWQEQTGIDEEGNPIIETKRRRLWQIRWIDLPVAAQTKLKTTGQLVIKATSAYIGIYDYTWIQVKAFFRNLKAGLNETEELQ